MLASSSFTGQSLAFRAQTPKQQRQVTVQVSSHLSRIGKQPVIVPEKVQVTLDGKNVKVKVDLVMFLVVDNY